MEPAKPLKVFGLFRLSGFKRGSRRKEPGKGTFKLCKHFVLVAALGQATDFCETGVQCLHNALCGIGGNHEGENLLQELLFRFEIKKRSANASFGSAKPALHFDDPE